MRVKRIEQIKEVNGKVILTMCLTLPCSFEPLLEWRRARSDKEIVDLLNKRDLDVTIQDDSVVRIKTTLKASTNPPQQESSLTQEKGSKPQVTAVQHPKNDPEDSSGEIRWCPYCNDAVPTTEEWESGKVIYRCKRCGYPIG